MASQRIGLFMAMAKVAALLPKLLGNMAPALFLLGVSLPPPVLPPLLLGGLLPPRLRIRRLEWLRAFTDAGRSTGPALAPALLGAALVRGAGIAGSSPVSRSLGSPVPIDGALETFDVQQLDEAAEDANREPVSLPVPSPACGNCGAGGESQPSKPELRCSTKQRQPPDRY
ncbi:hypothetical protein HPB50_014902 [Hyalomma asiaticum]|uniref:Uncharacterized protein n=1 Tax=Hyalomma asiaticum TaxID=266040 RepID=A0ACB7S2P8_HYAAI|nr:hypothetical protein HPB50_014902 [Hyalomma asiaticum]